MIEVLFQVRDDELEELDGIYYDICVMQVFGGLENTYGKVNILLQVYILRYYMDVFLLVLD